MTEKNKPKKTNDFNFSKENNYKEFSSNKNKKSPIIFILVLLIIVLLVILSMITFGTDLKNIQNKLLNNFNSNPLKSSKIENQNSPKTNNLINLEEYSKTSEGVAQKVIPSIVGITIKYTVSSPFNSGVATGSGSGIIISKDGYILTNSHVVNPKNNNSFFSITEAKSVEVSFNDDTKVTGKIVGTDEVTDLAIIKVEKDNLVPATLGNSDNVKIGEFAMAIGSPLGLKSTVTAGIISAVNRKVELNDGKTFYSLQTDASINEGNSGGALVNRHGEVIGINTLKFAGNGVEGIGFAIPINQTKKISEQLIQNKKIERPSLGVMGKEISKDISNILKIKSGVLVVEVIPNSSAANAGIQKGDIITKFNNKEISSVGDINIEKNNIQMNQEVDIEYIREGKKENKKIKMIADKQKKEEVNKNELQKQIQEQLKQNNDNNSRTNTKNNRNNVQDPFSFFDFE